MKVYFSASLSKTRNLLPLTKDIVQIIESLGHTVTSKHVVDPETTASSDWQNEYNPIELYQREMKRLQEADVLITEATIPSFGAGFLIDQAIAWKKPLLTLHYGDMDKNIPLMLRGREKEINLHLYTEEYIRTLISNFFESLN